MRHDVVSMIDESLAGLTRFQRATVVAASKHLQGKNGPNGRHLVGDEVGLGKTLIAKGVIATMLRARLTSGSSTRPFRVVYICSNLALARENTRKLAIFMDEDADNLVNTPDFGRLAELGVAQPAPQSDVVLDMRSITPATSFTLTQGAGNARERFILWKAICEVPYIDGRKLKTFFSMGVGPSWKNAENYFDESMGLEPDVCNAFSKRMGDEPRLDDRARADAKELNVSLRSWRTLLLHVSELTAAKAKNYSHLVMQVRTGLRRLFVECCAENLQADLFILDEFQRFRDLVNMPEHTDDEAQLSDEQIIAEQVLHKGEGYATLLLSATPFKALTHVKEDAEDKAHSTELKALLRYLCKNDQNILEHYQESRERLLAVLLNLPPGPLTPGDLDDSAKRDVESILRPYISRTERAAIEPDIGNTFSDTVAALRVPSKSEIESFIALEQLARSLKESTKGSVGMDVMMLYKSAPWCLSFLSGYQLREHLRNYRHVPAVRAALKQSTAAWLPYEKLHHYKLDLNKDVPCTRFKQVLDTVVPPGAEKLLWVPPSMPYYPGEGPFANIEGFSKTLLFSSLVLAPRALSGLVSYECERRILSKNRKGIRYFNVRKSDVNAMHFKSKSISPAWSLIYPSRRLALASEGLEQTSLSDLQARVRHALKPDVDALIQQFGGASTRTSARWYSLAPMLLDKLSDGEDLLRVWLPALQQATSETSHKAQLDRLSTTLEQVDLDLGLAPDDLLDYLANLAIAGPGVCALRSLSTTWNLAIDDGGIHEDYVDMLIQAADIAFIFIGKLNRSESQSVLREVCRGDKPWIAVARYAAMGNLQAVFDEYFHLLNSIHRTPSASVEAFRLAVDTGAVSVTAQKSLPPPQREKQVDVRFHCHYAIPLGNQKSTDEAGVGRITNARAAFNSPFWPFMLNSTSIGQEGLDFHWYCRRIVHWNLPGNPIDLEQREGRINRYKSLVVRQRVAETYAGKLEKHHSTNNKWHDVFELAKRNGNSTGLIPFWHCPSGRTKIERIVPKMPFSQEITRLDEILRILSLYRLSFGQPRQQELIENLLRQHYSEADMAEIRRALLVDLAPLNYA